MTNESKNRRSSESRNELARFLPSRDGGRPTVNKWSVIINIALTTLTAILSALGFTVG